MGKLLIKADLSNHWTEWTAYQSWSYEIIEQSNLLINYDLMRSVSRVNCLSKSVLWIIEQNKLLIQSWSYEIIEQSKLLLQSWSYDIIEQSKLLIKIDLIKSLSRINCWFKLILWNSLSRVNCCFRVNLMKSLSRINCWSIWSCLRNWAA